MHCEAVGKRYGRGRWILRDVELTLAPGDVLAVVGANGSGKSTLLRILAGLARPTTGRRTGPATARGAAVGYVPDRFTAHERLTAIAYLTHLGRIRGLPTATARARAGHLLDRLALVGGPDAELRTLSKGNAQKVALAQALLVPPDLLVLDEPWSGLDASAHTVLAGILAEVAAAGGAVAFTDHREALARTHATAVPHATAVHTVAGGRVTRRADPVPGAAVPPAVVVLGRPGGADEAGRAGVLDLPGVLAAERRGAELHLRVDRSRTDAVLLAALRDHWSVLAVTRPAPEPATAPESATAPEPEPDTAPTPRTTAR
ncbi:ATP-binding cassette domain-containing protein [Streptomyces sp. NRRL S-495]|uniref:ATP-binding cassette domain-containing protein n=1 Tax=Streptomyces sp. NRRL S-495 TaxID=1609133 RepID=UPI000D14B17F|nr:ATP-binding cassette domain-containing protein [Streptomyces sp. NRRL S-495]